MRGRWLNERTVRLRARVSVGDGTVGLVNMLVDGTPMHRLKQC